VCTTSAAVMVLFLVVARLRVLGRADVPTAS
jgi:hypothetical protein